MNHIPIQNNDPREIRCQNPINKIRKDRRVGEGEEPKFIRYVEPCNALLLKAHHGRGVVKCWRCDHETEWIIESGEPLRLEVAAEPQPEEA